MSIHFIIIIALAVSVPTYGLIVNTFRMQSKLKDSQIRLKKAAKALNDVWDKLDKVEPIGEDWFISFSKKEKEEIVREAFDAYLHAFSNEERRQIRIERDFYETLRQLN